VPEYNLINEQLLEIKLANEQVYSKKGAMIAYKGRINFARSFLAGGSVQDLAMRAVTSESFQLMSATGTGEVYYAHYGQYVTIIQLRGEIFYVESESLLAFDDRLRTGTVFLGSQGAIQGLVRGAATGQGLFTTTLQGNAELAILSDGNAIGLDVTPEKPVCVDPDAYIGHRGELDSKFATDVSWKTFIGQASGESYQLKFIGTGTVYIQASER
jgi:uncharacterized protein (AIM24 family)